MPCRRRHRRHTDRIFAGLTRCPRARPSARTRSYNYLKNRITDNCQTPYQCAAAYEICRVSQLFDPSFAVVHLTTVFVDELCDAVPALRGAAVSLEAELETYRVTARAAPALDHGDVKAFTEGVLVFWRTQSWHQDVCMA